MADISNGEADARASRRFIEMIDPERDPWVIGAPGLTDGWRWETFAVKRFQSMVAGEASLGRS